MIWKAVRPHILLLAIVVVFDQSVKVSDSYGPSTDLRLVVLTNGVAILPCEAKVDQTSVVQYSWAKDNVPIAIETGGRIQLTNEGHLWLKETKEEDSGIYVCHAVSNEGTTEVNVTLIVLVPDEVPYFTNISYPDATLQRTVGSSVKLRCPARGHPDPQITWFKDGLHLVNESEPDKTIGKWSLMMKNLKVTDSGNYTCFASNRAGTVNTSFPMQVVSKEKHLLQSYNGTRPDLSMFHPLNTTVKYGSSATFQCRVRSEATPNIQWLKKVEDSELETMEKNEHDIIKVQGENYRVLQSSEVIERSDGSFLNKLTIPEVYEGDSGKYICLGANAMGYSFRSAYLTVLPRPRALPLGWSRSVAVHPGHPSSLLVAIPITLGVIVGILVALVVLCHRRRADTPIPLQLSGNYRKADQYRRTSRTATTDLDTIKEEKKESFQFSEYEPEDFKENLPGTSRLQSEVELEGSGSVVTKLCIDPSGSGSYDGCFEMRHDV